VAHATRVEFAARHPVHVTVKLLAGLPGLREARAYRVVKRCFGEARGRFGLRLVHYAVLRDHVHLVCEAEGKCSLSRGMKGLGVRLARALNRTWRRRGQVIGDRYHARVLATPREVRGVLVYVLGNAARHRARQRRRLEPNRSPARAARIDPFTSGPWFGGFVERRAEPRARPAPWLSAPRTWLLARGWMRQGRISLAELGRWSDGGGRSAPTREAVGSARPAGSP